MTDPELSAVDGCMNSFFDHPDTAELVANKAPRKLVMVSRHKHDAVALTRSLEELLHHIVVRLRPTPLAAQLPAINDVAHQM